MKRITIAFLLFTLVSSPRLFAQDQAASIKWMSITEAEQLNKATPKKIIIDVYTDWCGWCKRLDATTYKDAGIVKYVNDNFYAVKLNAESKDKIVYQDKEYNYDPAHRINNIAVNFLNAQGGYPTTTFLNEKLEVISIVPGYMAADMMSNVLHFFGENHYLSTDWNSYLSSVNSTPKQ
jgi:thioredoxin-related protein